MDQFTQDLKSRVEKAFGQSLPWGDLNPLMVVGLTETVLDLGLNEEQIYQAIRSFARQLAAQVHPDRKPENVSPERQRQILEAFELLDDRENFARALAHFKTIRAEDRYESKLLSQKLSVLKKRLEVYEAKESAFRLDQERLAREIVQFNLKEKERVLDLQALEKKIARLEENIRAKNKQINSMVEIAPKWRTLHEHSMAVLANIGVDDLGGVPAFEARWVAFLFAIPENLVKTSLAPINHRGDKDKGFVEAIESLGIQSEMDTIINTWKDALEVYGGEVHYYGANPSRLGLSLVQLQAGKQKLLFGHPLSIRKGKVLGSIPREKYWAVGDAAETDKKKLERNRFELRSNLRATQSYEFIVATMLPCLLSGGLLVSVEAESRRKASWSVVCPAFRFMTRRIIIAAG